MLNGPRGGKPSADARAIKVAKVANGDVEGDRGLSSAAAELGRKGGKARAEKLSPEERSRIAKAAAASRWASKGL